MNAITPTHAPKRPTRWLLVSSRAYESITCFWKNELGPESQLAKRLEQGLIEPSSTAALAAQLEDLPRSAVGPVVVVFDRLDAAAYAAMDALPAAALQGLQIRLSAWQLESQSIVAALDADRLVDDGGLDIEEPESSFETHVVKWRRAAVPGEDPPYLEGSPEKGSTPEGPAAPGAPPIHEQLVLSRSRDDEAGIVQLALQVEGDRSVIDRYVGREVWVQADGRSFHLGPIQSDGFAHCEVNGPVNFANDQATLQLGGMRPAKSS